MLPARLKQIVFRQLFTLLASTCLLTACTGYSGNWPSLSEELPDTESRNRQVIRAPAGAPETSAAFLTDIQLETEADARNLITQVEQEIDKATAAYNARLATFKSGKDDEPLTLWNGAQLALTRLSQSSAPLDQIILGEKTFLTPFKEQARRLKDQTDAFAATERARLDTLRPE